MIEFNLGRYAITVTVCKTPNEYQFISYYFDPKHGTTKKGPYTGDIQGNSGANTVTQILIDAERTSGKSLSGQDVADFMQCLNDLANHLRW